MRKRLLLGAGIAAAALPLLVLAAVALSTGDEPVDPPREQAPLTAKADTPPRLPARQPAPSPTPPAPKAELRDEFALPPAHFWGREVKLGDFTVRAVTRYWAGPAPEVLTLEQAIDSGACVIRETGLRDRVTAEVSGARPVLVLVGDLLFGGRQDRLVAKSMVLEPGANSVPVFTAETWQWPAGTQPSEKVLIRDAACPQADLNVKAAVYQSGEQHSVTSAIMQVTRELEVPDAEGRGAYRGAFSSPRAAAIDEMVTRARRIVWAFTVGFVVYQGERLIAADLFESTLLLERLADKLLRSYAMTAVYGDVSKWKVEVPPATEPPAEPAIPTPPPYAAPESDQPHARYVIRDEDLIRRECRRVETGKTIHTGIFRK